MMRQGQGKSASVAAMEIGATRRPAVWWGVQALLIVLFVGWRAVNIDADPPADFIAQDIGYQIDEGYKTLSPRNLALFDATHWNAADSYMGWMERSPVTQWPYYFSFRTFGVERESARLVNVLFFGLFLTAAAIFLNRRGPPAIALAGILLLGTDMALFQFSRVGIFEMAVCLFLYTGLFIASSLSAARRFAPLVVLAVTAIVATFAVKASAVLYLTPPLALLVLVEMLGSSGSKRTKAMVVGITAAAGLAVLYLTFDIWRQRIDFSAAINRPSTLVFQPIYLLSPLAITLAYLATLDIYLKAGLEEFRQNRYLLAVASIALLVPVMLTAFRYDPPRYYLAVVPAALLVVVEWLRLYGPKLRDRPYRLSPARIAIIALFLLPLTASLAGFAGEHLVAALPFVPQGDDPGIDLVMLIRVYPVLLAAAAVVTVVLTVRRAFHVTVLASLLLGILGQVLFSVRSDLEAVFQPAYTTDEIQHRLTATVADGESIGGDWAPYFALGTEIPALYISQNVNRPENIRAIRPTYLLNSNTVWDQRTLAGLEAVGGVQVGDPIPLGTVFGHDVELLRLSYSLHDGSPVPD